MEVARPEAIDKSPVDFLDAAGREDFAELGFVATSLAEEDDTAGEAVEAVAAVGGLAGVALGLLFEVVLTVGAAFGEKSRGFVEGEESLVLKEDGGCGCH